VEELTQDQLKERFNDPDDLYYGTADFMKDIESRNTNYWGDGVLLIKGNIISPKAVQKVTEYEF
jgi:hypothetical protein